MRGPVGEEDAPASRASIPTLILRLLDRTQRLRWVIVLGVALLTSLLEAVAALLIFALVAMMTGTPPSDIPIVSWWRSATPGLDDTAFTRVVLGAIGAFFILRGAVVLLQTLLQARVAQDSGVKLSDRLVATYLRMPYEWHLSRNSAEMIRTAHDAVSETVGHVFVPSVALVSEALTVVVLLTLVMVRAPVMALITVGVMLPLVLGIARTVRGRLVHYGALNQDLNREGFRVLQQSFHGLRELKLFAKESEFLDEYHVLRETQARAMWAKATLLEVPRAVIEAAMVQVLLLFYLLASGAGDVVSTIGVFAYTVARVAPALNRISTYLNLIRSGTAAIGLVDADLHGLEAIAAHPRPASQTHIEFRHEIVLSTVTYRYPAADTDSLSGIDLTIRFGDSVGIVGKTGSGKTTLMDIVSGLLTPTEGTVSVDGVDIQDSLGSWQSHIGAVPQSIYLLDDTLRRNITLDRRAPDDAALAAAIDVAQLDSVVAELPLGLDTVLGERGVRLSGGQRQRVAVARALYRRPRVVLFDEGTSALDNATEAELVRSLESMRGQLTLVVIAHRLSTVERCSSIVVMDRSQIVDVGTFKDLSRRNPDFREFVTTRK